MPLIISRKLYDLLNPSTRALAYSESCLDHGQFLVPVEATGPTTCVAGPANLVVARHSVGNLGCQVLHLEIEEATPSLCGNTPEELLPATFLTDWQRTHPGRFGTLPTRLRGAK